MSGEYRGFALVLVLWTIALLTVIAGSFSFAMRSESSLGSNLVARAQAGALAEGGLRIGIARLLEPDEALRWRVDGADYHIVIDGHTVVVSLQSEFGKVDLNRASESLIKSMITAAGKGGDDLAVEQVTDSILDWRDRNRNRRLNGAEDADYAAAGLPYGSRDGPFISIQELTQLRGMTPQLFSRLAPLVTVYAGRPQIDPGTAPRGVLLGLPGVTEGQVDAYLDSRNIGAVHGLPSAVQLLTTEANVLSAPTVATKPASGTFSIFAAARVGTAVARRTMVVRARATRTAHRARASNRARRFPYTVLAWNERPLEMPVDPRVPLASTAGGRLSQQ